MLSRPINLALLVLKWPMALAIVLLTPGAALACIALIEPLITLDTGHAVLVGLIGYWVAWMAVFRRAAWGSAFSTLEHELTHALFATLTFHRVHVLSIRTTWRDGGEMSFTGGGNWLIYLAPYFFPTLTVVAGVAFVFQPGPWAPFVMGATWSYHLTSTWRETHGGQTDLHKAGVPFSVLVLPGLNLLAMGATLAMAMGGGSAALSFFTGVWRNSLALYS